MKISLETSMVDIVYTVSLQSTLYQKLWKHFTPQTFGLRPTDQPTAQ